MTGEVDRMSRAGSYVLGLMGDADRERAERDLEVDPEFSDAVLRVAERLRLIDLNPAAEPGAPDRWQMLAQRISEMPHMRLGSSMPAKAPVAHSADATGRGLHAVPSRRAAALAIILIATFAAGHLAALWRE